MKTKEIANKTIRITPTAHADLKIASEFMHMSLGGFIAWASKKYRIKATKQG